MSYKDLLDKNRINNSELAIYIQDLFTSEINYFEAASVCEQIGCASLVHMEGYESLAAGSVIQGITDHTTEVINKYWLNQIEQRLNELGITRVRIYLWNDHIEAAHILAERGYEPKLEIGLLCKAGSKHDIERSDNSIRLSPIHDEYGWREKKRIYDNIQQGPDGYSSPANKWVELEKQKYLANYMTPLLIYYNNEVCGTVNIAVQKRIVRLKNLAIHPEFHRLGIGRSASSMFSVFATQYGKAFAGCFALADEPSLDMYKKAGFIPVSFQTEWSKKLLQAP